MSTDRKLVVTPEQRERHLRFLERIGAVGEPNPDCTHPVTSLRFDGLQEGARGKPPMAWVTCLADRCYCSFLIETREDLHPNPPEAA
jgi:hypothetical protein